MSPHSNNYTVELVGIQISLQFLAVIDHLHGRNVHFFTDCQAAILTSFHNQLTKTKIEITLELMISAIIEKDNMIHVHWVPGNKDIMDNELADQQAKAASHEMLVSNEPCGIGFQCQQRGKHLTETPDGEKVEVKVYAVWENGQDSGNILGRRDMNI